MKEDYSAIENSTPALRKATHDTEHGPWGMLNTSTRSTSTRRMLKRRNLISTVCHIARMRRGSFSWSRASLKQGQSKGKTDQWCSWMHCTDPRIVRSLGRVEWPCPRGLSGPISQVSRSPRLGQSAAAAQPPPESLRGVRRALNSRSRVKLTSDSASTRLSHGQKSRQVP
jgi:hypothetical protein